MPKNKNHRQNGFTLIELMMVVAIIGALAALVVPRFAVSQETARTARVQADLRTIETAVVMFEADVGTLPTDISQLTTAYTPNGSSRIFGPYLKTTPMPPEGTVRVVDGGKSQAVEVETYNISTANDSTKGRVLLNNKYAVEDVR